MSGLSVIVIAKDEERDLPGCLESVAGLDAEIIVLDGQSRDRTLEVARRYTPHVRARAFDDYAAQKQAALDQASREWVLSLDADERLSPELRREIGELLPRRGGPDAYEIPFSVHFMGRRLRFGGLGGERHLRLFRRGAGRFSGAVHEGLKVPGPVGRLRGRIEHIPYRDLGEYLAKMAAYTDLAAKTRYDAGLRFGLRHHLLPFWELFTRVVLKLGFLDGMPGLVWAGLSAFHTWVKYVKLLELERRSA